MNKADLQDNLRHFTGTDNWFKHHFNKHLLYTDGVKFFAEHAGGGAYWFLDIIASEIWQLQSIEPFMVIYLEVHDSKAIIACEDGNDKEVYRREIAYTDCPEGSWLFYLTDNVLMITSEY